MNLLGIYTVGIAPSLCRRLQLDIVFVNCQASKTIQVKTKTKTNTRKRQDQEEDKA